MLGALTESRRTDPQGPQRGNRQDDAEGQDQYALSNLASVGRADRYVHDHEREAPVDDEHRDDEELGERRAVERNVHVAAGRQIGSRAQRCCIRQRAMLPVKHRLKAVRRIERPEGKDGEARIRVARNGDKVRLEEIRVEWVRILLIQPVPRGDLQQMGRLELGQCLNAVLS